jgi:hypothetical protein
MIILGNIAANVRDLNQTIIQSNEDFCEEALEDFEYTEFSNEVPFFDLGDAGVPTLAQ